MITSVPIFDFLIPQLHINDCKRCHADIDARLARHFAWEHVVDLVA